MKWRRKGSVPKRRGKRRRMVNSGRKGEKEKERREGERKGEEKKKEMLL